MQVAGDRETAITIASCARRRHSNETLNARRTSRCMTTSIAA